MSITDTTPATPTPTSMTFNPRDKLDQKQLALLDEIRNLVFAPNHTLTPREQQFCDDACLLRYLRARDWKVKKALKMLQGTLKWRREYKPDDICVTELAFEASAGKMFRRGVDNMGRPVIYMTPGRENSTDYQKNVQLLVYTIEQAIGSMEGGMEQMVWIADFEGYSSKNAFPVSVVKEIINILSNHYPERLGILIIVSAPTIFTMAYKTVKPLIPPVTKKKVLFAGKSTEDKVEALSKHLDMTQIERRFGGSSDFVFDPAAFLAAEEEFEKKRKATYLPSH